MFLPQLAVVFVGIAGGNRTVDTQVDKVLRDAHVEHAKLAATEIKALTHHRDASKDIVRRLHADGVIAGEIVDAHTLRIVIYRGDGAFKSLSETQVPGRKLGESELGVMKSNLLDEISTLAPASTKSDGDEIEMEPIAKPEPKIEPKKAAPPPPPPPPVAVRPAAQRDDDDETPPGLAPGRAPAKQPKIAKAVAPPPPAPKAEPEHEQEHDAAPTETAAADGDTVKADEIEAMMSSTASAESPNPSGAGDISLHLRATAGLGIATRSFAPGPSTVTGYSSSPVGAVQLGAEVAPTARTSLGVTFDRALGMTTPVANGVADTSMQRWEVMGTYQLVHGGSVDIAPAVGFGHRSFEISSTDPSRSPDGDYIYLVAGGIASAHVGRFTLRGTFAFEPVVSGNEMTESAFGEASRWALDVGAAVEARVLTHVFVRVAADYQRFAWSWNGAGARGAGGAVDAYPSGTMSLGADY